MDNFDYKALFDKSSELLAVIATDITVISATDAYLKAINRSNETISGKSILDVLANVASITVAGSIDDIYASLKQVIQNKTAHTLSFVIDPIDNKEATIKSKRYRLTHSPELDELNSVKYIIQRLEDVKEIEILKAGLELKKTSLNKISANEKRYYTMLMKSPFAFSIMMGESMVVTLANDLMKTFWGKGKDVEGKPLLQILPELKDQPFPDMISSVLNTGTPIYANEILAKLMHNNKIEERYFNIVYQPYYEDDETISGVSTIAYEVTDFVNSRKKAEESGERFRHLVMHAPVAICLLRGKNYVIETINESMVTMWDRTMEEALNKPAFDVLTEFQDQGLKELLDQVYNTGENVAINELALNIKRNGILETIFVKFVYEPWREADGTITGVMALAHEITDQVIARKQMEAQALMHQDMLMNAPGFVCTLVGPTHVYTLVNEQYQMLFGKRKIKGKPVMLALPELEGQGFDKLLDNVYNTGESFVGFDIPITLARDEHLAPEVRYFNFSYQPMYDENKSIYSILVFGYEVTDIVVAKKRIEESEKLFRQLLDTMPQIAWTNTVEGEITFYNQRWYDYTGLDHMQSKALGCKAIIHADDLQNALDKYHSIRETSDGGEFQIRIKRLDDAYRWHLIRLMPVKNEKGTAQLWMGTATDIQELKLLQQQKDDFISIASHELKTPITTIKASLQLLNRMKDDPSHIMLPKLIAQANKSLDKVSVLMDDLLNASIANEGQLHINKKRVILSEIIEECCPHVRAEGIYTIKSQGEIDIEVYADAARIDQVIINFVNNAIKYASGSKEILIDIEKANNMAKVSVTDKGPGIPPDKLLHLFDRFYRADSSGSQYSGLGLGLYISAEIIKKHQGQIGVNSVLNEGSTFWFTLPIA